MSPGPLAACHSMVPRWCALYINLERRQDRRGLGEWPSTALPGTDRLKELLQRRNQPLWERLERVQAVDKQDLSLEDELVVDAVAPQALERARRAEEEKHYTIVHDEVRGTFRPQFR